MHPDLPRLLDVQSKDRRLAALDERTRAIAADRATLDALLERSRAEVTAAERAARDSGQRGSDAELKLQTQRAQHERRRERLEQERNPRVAAQLMADVELGRSILAQEETEWLRLAEDVTARNKVVTEARTRAAAAEGEQAVARAELDRRQAEVDRELEPARAERESAASQLDRTLRVRYDRLSKSRKTAVLVPASGINCTACHTAIPTSRIGKLRAEGLLLDGCEMCGAIIYVEDPAP
jgi:predicted  nucleic acid-binding Zn-ribbon protein